VESCGLDASDSWYSRNIPSFMKPEGTLPCSQKPADGSYPVHTLPPF